MAKGATRQPAPEDSRNGQASGDEGIREVPFRPRLGSNQSDGPLGPRGENAAPVRQPRTRSSIGPPKHGDANPGNVDLQNGPAPAPPSCPHTFARFGNAPWRGGRAAFAKYSLA